MSWPCPVCGAPYETTHLDRVEGVVCEMEERCPNGCMEYNYAYGGSRERIGDRWWEWHYTETPEANRRRRADREVAITELRRKK